MLRLPLIILKVIKVIRGIAHILGSKSFVEAYYSVAAAFSRRGFPIITEYMLTASDILRPLDHESTYVLGSLRASRGKTQSAVKILKRDVQVVTGTGGFTHTRALCFDGQTKMTRSRVVDLDLPDINARAVYFVAGDSEYFCRYGKQLAISIHMNAGAAVHFHAHVVNPNKEAVDLSAYLRDRSSSVTVSAEKTDLSNLSDEQRRVYYSCARYMLLPQLRKSLRTPLIVADLDQMVMSDIATILEAAANFDIAVLRMNENRHSLFAILSATVAVFSPTEGAIRFTELLAANISSALSDDANLVWHLDQGTLAMTHFANPQIKCGYIPESVLDLDDYGASSAVLWSITNSTTHNLKKLDTEMTIFNEYRAGRRFADLVRSCLRPAGDSREDVTTARRECICPATGREMNGLCPALRRRVAGISSGPKRGTGNVELCERG
jgi:hypothetical protein